jgi:UDP-N-acetyl-alpha-D-muramoyl-L-alanyl-L-glutamate epimerase
MASTAGTAPAAFDPSAVEAFRFVSRELRGDGRVTLRYALDDLELEERVELPVEGPLADARIADVEGLLSLLHWVAGVSYYKAALPGRVECESGPPTPAAATLLEALYSEGLGELAYANGLPLPRPRFPSADVVSVVRPGGGPSRVLVPVGGGKDSAVAIEVVRASGLELGLFSVGDATSIIRTAEVAGLPRLVARRTIDPGLLALNGRGAINGHVPITAIVSCIALLTAALHGFDAVAMANERSASSANLVWDGVAVNHQFSKSLRAERMLAAAVAEAGTDVGCFSVLRPASELAIARAFARLSHYHRAFTSCNAVFRLDPELRSASWCGDCPKCRFVYLALAPFTTPEQLAEIFGRDLLADETQFEGFALLTATGGHKPFECVGEERESLAAIAMLARDERWREHSVVRRLVSEVLAAAPAGAADPVAALALSDDHDVPPVLLSQVHALLGA